MARVTSFKFHLIFMQFLGHLFKVEQGVCLLNPQDPDSFACRPNWILLKSALYYKELY